MVMKKIVIFVVLQDGTGKEEAQFGIDDKDQASRWAFNRLMDSDVKNIEVQKVKRFAGGKPGTHR
jgi:hypothetical protein